jgi:hypothetical protein
MARKLRSERSKPALKKYNNGNPTLFSGSRLCAGNRIGVDGIREFLDSRITPSAALFQKCDVGLFGFFFFDKQSRETAPRMAGENGNTLSIATDQNVIIDATAAASERCDNGFVSHAFATHHFKAFQTLELPSPQTSTLAASRIDFSPNVVYATDSGSIKLRWL